MDRLSVEILGREIYRCNIKNLQFNIECENDIICRKLVDIVQEASSRLYAVRNFPKYHPITKGKRIIQEIKSHDLFSSDIKLWFEIPKNPVHGCRNKLETTDGEEEQSQQTDDKANFSSNLSSSFSIDADIPRDSKII